MGDKRTGRSTAGNGVQNRGFYFQIAFVIQNMADTLDNLGPFDEDLPDFRIYNQIHITLAVTDFLVLQAVPFFRQGFQGLAEEFQFLYANGRFTHMGFENNAFHAYNIANIQQFYYAVGVFAHFVLADIQLNLTGFILQIHKAGFAMAADGHQTASHLHYRTGSFHSFYLIMYFFGMMGYFIGMAKRQNALFFQLPGFFQTNSHLFVQFFFAQAFLCVRGANLFFGHEITPWLSSFWWWVC